jgi:hypothetical protein
LISSITILYNNCTSTLTIRDFPHEGRTRIDVDDGVFVGGGGKTKVTDLDVTRRVEKDIPRFQVTVDHTLFRHRKKIYHK